MRTGTNSCSLIGTLSGSAFLLIVALASGCSAWSERNHEERTAEAIDARLNEGMSRERFEASFPEAQLIESDGTRRSYLVNEQSACFLCSSRSGFRRSRDVFARVVHFEDGLLSAIEPAPELPR